MKGDKISCTLHEHLNQQLQNLIAVNTPSTIIDTDKYKSLESKNLSIQDLIQDGKNEERRQNKLLVVTKLLEALREDQTGLSNTTTDSLSGNQGWGNRRIHGCVGSHWELLPSEGSNSSDDFHCDELDCKNDGDIKVTKREQFSEKNNFKEGNVQRINDDVPSKIKTTVSIKNVKNHSNRCESATSSKLNFQGSYRGGSALIPGRRTSWTVNHENNWEETQPEESLSRNRSSSSLIEETSIHKHNDKLEEESSAKPTTDPPIESKLSMSHPTIKAGGLRLPGLDWNKMFKKGYTILMWVRPSLGSTQASNFERRVNKQVLYRFASSPFDNASDTVGVCAVLDQWRAVSTAISEKESHSTRTFLTTTVTAYTLPNLEPKACLYPARKLSTNLNENSDARRKDTNDLAKGKSHLSNTDHVQHFHSQQCFASDVEMSGQRHGIKNPNTITKQGNTNSRTLSANIVNYVATATSTVGCVIAQLTLPADEWSLIGIQHTHPYLRRPELIISVNGEDMVQGELGYPTLDGTIVEEGRTGGLSPHTSVTPSSTSPVTRSSHDDTNETAFGAIDSDVISDNERKMLRLRGILAECTLLDGAFENGVITGSDSVLSCNLSVHSIALLQGKIPNAVLAMIAERGPMGDSTSGSALSFVLGPVPTNPQNRDAVVALCPGHGHYGASEGNRGSTGEGIIGGMSPIHGERAPPRSLGIPVSIGISPGVILLNGGDNNVQEISDSGSETWIGGSEEHSAHVCLQGLLGRALLSFHSGDTLVLGNQLPSSQSTKDVHIMASYQVRIVCPPSVAPSCIGGTETVPKVGIVRPTVPAPLPATAKLVVFGNAKYHNLTRSYVHRENLREQMPIIERESDKLPPISFVRAVHASNAIYCALLPFRLALPRAGIEEVNSMQHTLHVESYSHINDLLSNEAEFSALLIDFISECISCGGSTIRDDALQNGMIHVLVNLLRRVLIRAGRLGLLTDKERENCCITQVSHGNRSQMINGNSTLPLDDFDYDNDHDSSCPLIIPLAICKALIRLVDACCGPPSISSEYARTLERSAIIDPFRGVLRIRRASDLALTALFSLTLDFDFLGKDSIAASLILEAVVRRYCQISTSLLKGQLTSFDGPDYGFFLRSQVNLQFLLDTIRVRFDSSGSSSYESTHRYSDQEQHVLESVASSLSDLIYSMLLSTLVSSSGNSITRGERDVGGLVSTLTECPLGSVCAHVVTNALAKLLVQCGALSSLCLGDSPHQQKRSSSSRCDQEHAALENRLARNLLLCHYHDIVAPLVLSRSAPNSSLDCFDTGGDKSDKDRRSETSFSAVKKSYDKSCCILDWTSHWRLTLLTFLWLTPLAAIDESLSASISTGNLLLAAAKSGSLNGALLGNRFQNEGLYKAFMITILSQLLVLRSTGEKDYDVIIKRAESTSRRLSVFLQLLPGIAYSLLSRTSNNTNNFSSKNSEEVIIDDDMSFAADALKEIMSMLSLSIQSLYGNRKSGLLVVKAGNKVSGVVDRAKRLLVPAAKEYAPILLFIVTMLEKAIKACRASSSFKMESMHLNTMKPFNEGQLSSAQSQSDSDELTGKTGRKRTDSSDRDWVNVRYSLHTETSVTADLPSNVKLSPVVSPMTTTASTTTVLRGNEALDQKCYKDLVACQDIALYAISRLVAQAMKYGGGEATTLIWRDILCAVSNLKSVKENNVSCSSLSGFSSADGVSTSNSVLIHLAALVLSKFARSHGNRVQSLYSPWTLESCSAVARLLDLVEEKRLLSNPDNLKNQECTKISSASIEVKGVNTLATSWKYSIDQVRLLKSLLEIMSSGRESSGWSQIQPILSRQKSVEGENEEDVAAKYVYETENGSFIDKATLQSNYELYHQNSSKSRDKHTTPTSRLLPILQSCLRLTLPSISIIRSEAVVVASASDGKSPSTAVLIELVSSELNQSITAAIMGLSFPASRDVFMNAVTSLRRSIDCHKIANDNKAANLCIALLFAIIESMHLRYIDERNKKEDALYDAYDGSGKSNDRYESSKKNSSEKNRLVEGVLSETVEKLIIGEDLIPKSDSADADFVAFPLYDNVDTKSSRMGWSHYKGLGAALDLCHLELHQNVSIDSKTSLEDKASFVLRVLESYIDTWDETLAQDADEAELIDLFDETISNHSSNYNSTTAELHLTQSGSNKPKVSSLSSHLSASDAMTRFIEAQSLLKHQHHHLAHEYLVSRRLYKTYFAERLCWKTWMDCIKPETCQMFWERGINDGGRDSCSRIVTLPTFPQFPRYIPSYLDHSSNASYATLNQEINLVSQGITIVDITKKDVPDEILRQFESADDGAIEDALPESLEEDELDVLFPQLHVSQTSSDQSMKNICNDEKSKSIDLKENPEEMNLSEQNASVESIPRHDIDKKSFNFSTPGNFHFASSSFFFPPDSSSLHSMGEGVSLCGGSMEEYYSSCLQIKPECSRKCVLILTESHLILEFEDGNEVVEGENESYHFKARDSLTRDEIHDIEQRRLMEYTLRPKAMRWNISEMSHIYLRRYRLRDSALELFFIPSAGATTGGSTFFAGSRSLFIDFGAGTWGNTRRDDAANALMRRAPIQTVKQWPDKSGQFLHDELKKLTQAWTQGAISNFDYISSLNCLSGRSYNDICQYPVFPWVLSNFSSETVPDLSDKANFRDLSKPIGALNEVRLADLIERFETFSDPSIPPFMYGSHYSTSAGVVLHFLLRLHPFSSLHRQLQSGHFDVADRLFSSVQRTWEMCTGRSAAEVKELIPEFYCNPAFLRNSNELKLGTMQEGEVLGDVVLPPWANGSAEKFIEVMRLALESDVCSEGLGSWIDLIFGFKQRGKKAIEAHNVFFYLTYYGSVDIASIEDEGLRRATECQIAHFGQCPMQLFYRPHVSKLGRGKRHSRQSLSETFGLYDQTRLSHLNKAPSDIKTIPEGSQMMRKKILPFMDSPLSHWVHLASPPPGPHVPLISIRLTLADRCLAVDSKGVYHFFRWAWKPEIGEDDHLGDEVDYAEQLTTLDLFKDKGCFIAQRELFSFRNIPRLPYVPVSSETIRQVTVSVSKTLFANRTLLLVLSDGDGRGGLAMQLLDPVKGIIRGEVIVPSAHADYITSIDMDPIGTASGQGGVGGELAVVGSADGSLTLWRFISSHYWPLRPRLRMTGHSGAKVYGVAISSALGICASVSSAKCCLFDIGNGAMIRKFSPPIRKLHDCFKSGLKDEVTAQLTVFADTSAICLSVLGFVVVVCSTQLIRGEKMFKEVFSLELFTLEGVHVGSRILEQHQDLPKKVFPSIDGRAIFVCAGGGISVHLISSLTPLATIDEWQLSPSDGKAMFDIDFGPTVARPVVVAAGCSEGALRLHALPGISKWSRENQRNTMTSAVGNVLALPAQTVKNALGGVAGIGSRFVGFGKEIGREAFSVVKERDGGFFFRRKG